MKYELRLEVLLPGSERQPWARLLELAEKCEMVGDASKPEYVTLVSVKAL